MSLSEDLGRVKQLEVSLVYPRKMGLKQLASIFNYCKGVVILNNGDKIYVGVKARWTERRYGKFKLVPDTTNFRKYKEAYIEIDQMR